MDIDDLLKQGFSLHEDILKNGKISRSLIFKCGVCQKESQIGYYSFLKRKKFKFKKLCINCFFVKRKNYPDEILDIINDKVLPYERVLPVFEKLKTKKKICFTCKICCKISNVRFDKFKNRKYGYKEPICNKCILKYTTNTNKWKAKNSKAQFLAQNRKEVILKHKQAQRKLIAADPFYADKRRSRSYVSGKINGYYFDSSWELLYLVYCLENKDIENVKRCKDKIRYLDYNNIPRYYYPDFIVKYVNGTEHIVEIKGGLSKNVLIKEKYALKKYGKNYKLLYKKDLENLGIFVRSSPYLQEQYKKIIENYDVTFNPNSSLKKWIKNYSSDKNNGKNQINKKETIPWISI